jgi:dipeptidyl aminopeptidase/acylaminoacyl peptidase
MERLIEFANRAGHQLRGMIHLPEHSPAPGVVLFHGFTGDRMESHWLFVKCSRALARAGLASLRFDFFGSGESEGEFREATLETEIADAEDAVGFFRRQEGIDSQRIGLLGLSLGGALAALTAERVGARALVLWSAVAHFPRLEAVAETLTQPFGNDGTREYAGHEISPRFLEAASRLDPLAGVAGYRGPTLVIHPERDEHLPLNHPEDYFHASAAPVKEIIIIPGADHTFSSIGWEREVISRTVEWFRSSL